MGWWIAFAILFLLAILPLGIRIRYDSEGFLLRVFGDDDVGVVVDGVVCV